MDDKRDKRGNAGLYVLGGVAIIVVLVWVISY
jgi:hypothetical protein